MDDDTIILPNVRLWVYVSRVNAPGNLVKLTIRPGEGISRSYFGRSGEGRSKVGFDLSYDRLQACLSFTRFKDGTDCDGRHSSSWTKEANIIDCTDDGQPIWCEPSYRLYD